MHKIYLYGQNLKSSSEDLYSKSTKEPPSISSEHMGSGFSSIVQILFFTNPCCSSDPPLPNYNDFHKSTSGMEKDSCRDLQVNKTLYTCGKHIGIPPLIAFGALKIAYNSRNHSNSENL